MKKLEKKIINLEEEPKKKRKPVVLEDSEVDSSDIDDSEEMEYYEKSRFINAQPMVEVGPCYLPDFISQVFARDFGEGVEEEPFEARGCERYKRWRDEENNHLPHDSYKESQFQYNPIAFFKSSKIRKQPKKGQEQAYEQNCHKIVLKDDWEGRDWLQTRHFALMSPITYVGGTTENKNARFLYAFAIDLDGVGIRQLHTLFTYMIRLYPENNTKPTPMDNNLIIPIPNIIVNSGHGLHLYYTMQHPLAMYPENVKYLQAICRALYKIVSYPKTKGESGTTKQEKVQCLGIYHAFRLPETFTKILKKTKSTGDYVGHGVPIEAWIANNRHYTLNDLMPWMWFAGTGIYEKLTPSIIEQLERGGRMLDPKRLTLQKAREKYGEKWYANREKPKGRFVVSRRLYVWWLNKLRNTEGVKEGHRYYCIMALAAFAAKCNVPLEELKTDAYSLIDIFNRLTVEKEPFEEHDVKVALKAYNNPDVVRWRPEMLSAWTDIPMKRTKRNKRKQDVHLRAARFNQTLDDPDANWRNKDGRPEATLDNSKEAALIREWIDEHPDSTNKAACARELGMSRTTVTKWWKMIEEIGNQPIDSVKPIESSGLTSDDIKQWLKDSGFKELIEDSAVVIDMAKIWLPNAESPVYSMTIEEVRETVTSGKWKQLGWELRY